MLLLWYIYSICFTVRVYEYAHLPVSKELALFTSFNYLTFEFSVYEIILYTYPLSDIYSSQTVCEVIAFFVLSGYHLYAKSSYMYLQTILELPKTHPDIQRMFQNDFHTICRNDIFWAGLSSDLVIEPSLM